METIGDRIKLKRKEAGLTQVELASILNVTDRAISKWESNEGNPDISTLPRIAKVFDITLDYLMTGREPEKEVIVMSKLELCAKNDDPTMIDSLSSNRDEDGKNLLYYVKKYNSKKVLLAMIDSGAYEKYFIRNSNSLLENAKKIVEIIMTCLPLNRERKVIKNIYNCDIRNLTSDIRKSLNEENNFHKDVVEEFKKIFKFIIDEYDNLTDDQKNYYTDLKDDEDLKKPNCWFDAYPYFVEYSIMNNNDKLLDLLLNKIEIHNKWIKDNKPKDVNDIIVFTNKDAEWMNKKNVYLLESTFDYLISNKNFALAYRVNSLLKEPHSKREIELLEVENDSKVSEKSKLDFRCVDCNMIIPSEVEKLRNIDHVKSILNNNYLNYYEMVYKLLKTNKKALFKFFVDNNLNEFSELLMANKQEDLLDECWNYFNYKTKGELILKQPLIVVDNINSCKPSKDNVFIRKSELEEFCNDDLYNEYIKANGNKIIEFYDEYKEKLQEKVEAIIYAEKLEEQNKINKSNIVKELTAEYFEDLLSKNNDELFIIKLCSLFDAILRFDYKCEAEDFCGEMKLFFDNALYREKFDSSLNGASITNDKTWEEYKTLMNKLRIQRNSIVHPESDEIADLNKEDLKDCLYFVFKVNEGSLLNG